MDETERSRLDALLDLLADEVAQRLEERWGAAHAEPDTEPAVQALHGPVPMPDAIAAPVPEPTPEPEPEPEPEPTPAFAPGPVVASVSHAASSMTRLAIGVLLIVVLINIPLNCQGTALARSIPSSASLVIRNGLLVKEAGSPDVWVYRDDAFHWITSLEAFGHYGYRWQDVHVVEDGYLNQFQKGRPLYVLLKCDRSPHIYQLDQGSKRWIVDIPTLEAAGYVWKDVQIVPCSTLRSLPDGDSIPPGRGSPPPPLP